MTGVPVLVTESVVDYRKAINVFITKDDIVLELGSAQGITSALLAAVAKEVHGVDKSPAQHNHSSTRYPPSTHPNLHFHNLDAYTDLRTILSLNKPFTHLFIDVSGNRKIGDVLELIDMYENAMPSLKRIIVKCFPMKRMLVCCQVWPPLKDGGDSGNVRKDDVVIMKGRKDNDENGGDGKDPYGTMVTVVLGVLLVTFGYAFRKKFIR
ncbi:hypothetical protein HDU76_009346 [Blyttiomyces sp. JEL0837]|nr:hypothetical protein HDU76_009346 [Blyttiomyces sp. JEL0837]